MTGVNSDVLVELDATLLLFELVFEPRVVLDTLSEVLEENSVGLVGVDSDVDNVNGVTLWLTVV